MLGANIIKKHFQDNFSKVIHGLVQVESIAGIKNAKHLHQRVASFRFDLDQIPLV
jgi:hypothetical protein